MKGESRKIHRALLTFYKSTIIPTIRWSFERARFYLNPDHLLKPLKIDPTPVFERLNVPDLSFDEAFIHPEQLDPRQLRRSQQSLRQRTPGPIPFAISFIADVDVTTGKSRGGRKQ
jgi:hypothetical protein